MKKGKRSLRRAVPPPDNRQQCPICLERIPPERFADHHTECLRRRALVAQIKAARQPAAPTRPAARTIEGYTIDRCVLCGQRVCLVPDGAGGYRSREVERRAAGTPHICDGATSGGRRSKLVYVDRELGTINRVNHSRPQRKDGGPQEY